ncbi:lysophospholipid acyltransferase family protein [Ruficoccus sp. ZRK36]|uniref:lysophospholipid acyltransferase family protein n=1 Tax=Ruficoccus sp. ZRK36 TaxID=2866311 RepID=UPI001C72C28E|nr:lysophospholipid acyltransferase family protein [Ruficoccus sp. ZRK36]QYY35183.1 lysophospholipid acyltransferase family protein [Ruficoccus sp. ZRK36]
MSGGAMGVAYKAAGPAFERLFKLNELDEAYLRVVDDPTTPNFFQRAMRAMDISYEISDRDLERIPREGPLLVVSNHPYGGLDGVVLGALLTSVREDAKLLANYLLEVMKEIKPWLIAVDPFDRPDSARFNFKAMKETIRHLCNGGCIGTFPSGTVSHYRWRQRQITDPTWSPNTARLIHKSQATVVPCYFEGGNGMLFHMGGLVHPRLRTLMLPREMIRMMGSTLRLRVGNPIPYRKLAEFSTNEELVQYLRLNTYILAKRAMDDTPRRKFNFPRVQRKAGAEKPLATAVPPETLEKEISSIPSEQLLVEHGVFQVYYAFASQIPNLLDELGRLREKTFREVGEGTGEPSDTDRFDLYYRHLFMWDVKARKIVGAYRVGLTDEILLTHGKSGLYTSTLFKFKSDFLEKLDPALEMGRSFIVSEYQKKHASLSLIWRGIGQFVCRHPQYKTLFGPVSISQEYNAISKDLMVKFLRKNRLDPSLAQFVKAKNPPRGGAQIRGTEKQAFLEAVKDIDDISALISEIETDHKGIPVLLRHYLKMNGNLLSFNVDTDFGHCVDGLIVVDLTQADARLLRSYMGTNYDNFMAFHQAKVEADK